MTIRDGIRAAILADAGIAALVADRVWGSFTPNTADKVGPWITYVKLFGAEESSHSGDAHLTHPTYQFTIGGTDIVKVNQVQALLVKFNAFNYAMADGRVLTFFHKDDRDAWSDGTRVQEPTVDLEVWLEE